MSHNWENQTHDPPKRSASITDYTDRLEPALNLLSCFPRSEREVRPPPRIACALGIQLQVHVIHAIACLIGIKRVDRL
ncbi:hypothetical protein L596_004235 [Steinernema carpocapsae]|uniref:Uncharacterized protein n=1 Tax=Steinernema carpocapsae TaxID=34508 RepID=A0A4V6I8A1_STECR|nr:hypothetical protein L596_004235 [Steinernema carpocapsae]